MTEHTPTPWDRTERLSASENHRGFVLWGRKGERIGDIAPYDEEGLIGRANSGLIVRAVNSHANLLAALKAVEWHRTSAKWGTITTDVCPSCGETVIEGHASDCQLALAIKKAEGE
jgi:hypothetical protein